MSQADPSLLQRQRQLLEEIAGLLQRELDLLLAADVTALPAMAERKMAICRELEDIELGLAGPQGAADVARSQGVRDLARQVADANQRNGMVVAALMRNTQGALDILRGIPGAPPVYGHSGQTVPTPGGGKPLGQA